jgi:four helix bundle protein
MRDHTRLRVFQFADGLVCQTYLATRRFPSDEQFGLTSQMRRAAISVVANIIEGCARSTEKEYLRFLDIAYGSVKELEYYLELSERLDYFPVDAHEIRNACEQTAKLLCNLIIAVRKRTH